ncbi:MAG: UDP-N-acetylmuramoyl-L-alanine--D-glutamate ligase [Planctomycetota bacterium]
MIRREPPEIPTREALREHPLSETFRDLRVLVFGLGRFGGGSGVTRFFAERGARVTVTDLSSEALLAPVLEPLRELPIERFRLGEHREDDFFQADWIVVNPAVPPRAEFLEVARRSGAKLVTEVGLFLRWCPSRWVTGITGSNGKSTTSQLCAEILRASGHVTHLGGNIGRSLLPELSRIEEHHRVVLELSSFQLERLLPDEPTPRVAAITHFTPNNHLDWHGDAEAYRLAKERILRPGPEDSVAVLARRSPHFEAWSAAARAAGRQCVAFAPDEPVREGIGWDGGRLVDARTAPAQGLLDVARPEFAGTFQAAAGRSNLACATACALAMGATPAAIAPVVAAFRGLPHRQELVAQARGVRFVNDSKATTPEATAVAIEAFGPNLVLLVGGRFKGSSYTELARAIVAGVRHVCVFGECAAPLADAIRAAGARESQLSVVRKLDTAFAAATRACRPTDTILLSPACASFDQFTHFEERGESFRALAQSWVDAGGPQSA